MKWSIYIIKFASLILYFCMKFYISYSSQAFVSLMGNTCTFLFLWRQAGCELVISVSASEVLGLKECTTMPGSLTHVHIHSYVGGGVLFDGISCIQAGLKLAMLRRITEDDPKFRILLPLLPKCWDHRHVPPHPFQAVLRMEPHP